MTAIVDTLTDLLVSGLEAVDFYTTWGYAGQVEIEAMSLPDFAAIDAVDVTQIKVSAYPNADLSRIDRTEFGGDQKLGICIVRKLEFTNGKPDETEFRDLKSLAQSIYQWVWTGASGYEKKCISVGFPAWFDFEKAKGGVFMTTIQPVYRLGFSS